MKCNKLSTVYNNIEVIDKINIYASNLHEPYYKLVMNKYGRAVMKYFKDVKYAIQIFE